MVQSGGVEEAVGGVDRWGAALVVTRRGSIGGPGRALCRQAIDLGIEVIELSLGDDGRALPGPT